MPPKSSSLAGIRFGATCRKTNYLADLSSSEWGRTAVTVIVVTGEEHAFLLKIM